MRARVASDRANARTYAHISLARTLTRTYIRSHVRSLARMSFTHTVIPPFMSLVTTRTLDNKNMFTRLLKKLSNIVFQIVCQTANTISRGHCDYEFKVNGDSRMMFVFDMQDEA